MPLEHNGLVKLSEECGELVQAAMKKIARSDGEEFHWDGSNLKERLADEIADVFAAADVVVENNGLDEKRIGDRRLRKAQLFRYWHAGGIETKLPQTWCHECGGDADKNDPCELCGGSGLIDQHFDSSIDVDKQEEIVSILWAFGRQVGDVDDATIREAVRPALDKILGQFKLGVVEIQ